MQIILSRSCYSLTGLLRKDCGYAIQRRKNGFFAKRNQRGFVPPYGHWMFIVTCAKLAQTPLYIADIRLTATELQSALYEAGHFIAAQLVRANANAKAKATYNAADVLNLKTTFGL